MTLDANIQNMDTQKLQLPLNVTLVLLMFLLMVICQSALELSRCRTQNNSSMVPTT